MAHVLPVTGTHTRHRGPASVEAGGAHFPYGININSKIIRLAQIGWVFLRWRPILYIVSVSTRPA